MKKIKNIITMVVLAAVVISMIWFYQVCINIPVGNGKVIKIGLGGGDWTKKYKLELDRFFGEENWECISKEKKDSIILEDSQYTNWSIRFKDKYGEEHTAVITNHVFLINNSGKGYSSTKRYSEKQAFYLELLDISCGLVSNEIHNDIIKSELTEEEASSVYVRVLANGNPEPKFYDALAKEQWFTVNKLRPENLLFNESHQFRIEIPLSTYRFGKLTKQQQKNVLDSFERIEKRILDKYGEKVSFEIRFDDEHRVNYNG